MQFLTSFRNAFRKIHFVDKCLLVILGLLMLQAAYSLFASETTGQEQNNIDIIVRTSAASIFGYFVSANFGRSNRHAQQLKSGKKPAVTTTGTVSDNMVRSQQIGFSAAPTAALEVAEAAVSNTFTDASGSIDGGGGTRFQEAVVTAIGFIALLLLLAVRDFGEITTASIGTISQLRDFVSGCIGFLIGCATGRQPTTTSAATS